MKYASTLKTAPHTLSPRQRGSLIILVVVVLVLVTVAAIVYLQVARSDRAAVDRMHQSNIDQVIQSTVAHIQQVLLDDLVDENGDFLVPGAGRSIYDYPWTNPANPGTGDNRHLASTRLEQGQWRHVTNLMGQRVNPANSVVSNIDPSHTNNVVPAALNADADGDGTNDSLFQPAPVFQIGDIQYTIAPRIVDLSSMINLNVAGSLAGSDPTRVRGYYPTDVDLARFFNQLTPIPPATEWQAVLAARGMNDWPNDGITSVDPTTGPPESRAGNWFEQGRIWHHREQVFDLYEEFSLRSRSLGAARRPSTTSRIESLMPAALDAQRLNQFTTFSGHSPIMVRWGSPTFPRPWPGTTPNAAGQPTRPKVDQFDLNAQLSTEPNERIPMLMRLFRAAFEAGTIAYQGMDDTQIEIAAIEAALAVDAYSGGNAAIRSINYTGSDPQIRYFGLKPLPFIREVYLQWAYEDRLEEVDPGTGDPPQQLYTHWLRNNDSFAMAIELGNPFDEPVNVRLAERPIRIRVVYGGAETAVAELGGLTFTNGTGTLPPQGAPLIVYSNPSAVFLEDGQGGNLANDLGFAARHRAMLPSGTLRLHGLPTQGNLNLQNVVIELQTRQGAGGTWITYDRFFFRSADDPGAVLVEEPVGADPAPGAIRHDRNRADPSHRHMQLAVARDGANARFLSNRGRDLTLQRDLPTPAGDPAFQTSVSLGQQTKPAQAGGTITGDSFFDNHPILIAGRPIHSVAELGWIMLRGFTSEDSGDLPQRLSGPDGGAGFLSSPAGQRRLFLDIRPTVPRTEIADIGAIPHAAILINMFTTLHPQFDGVDNNGSGNADDPTERLVRGTINVNTASRDVLMSLPLIENPASRQALVDAIIEYRDNPASRGGIRPDFRGIASIGELLFVNPEGLGNAANMQAYGQVDPGLAPGDPMRLYPMPEQTNKVALDSPGTTPQDRLARFQMLSQILTTRSDLYAAWVLVEGYRAGAWDEGPVESARFIAIFDRSEVRTANDQVKVLGVFRVE